MRGFRRADEPPGRLRYRTRGAAADDFVALYRESDRLLLAPDVVYTIDTGTCANGPPRAPHPAFNWDDDLARACIDRLRELGPSSLWTGHGSHLSGDIGQQLDAAAAARWPDAG